MKIFILTIVAFLFGQVPVTLDLPKVRTAFVQACKPQLEPWTELGSHIGAGAHIFLLHEPSEDYPATSATFNITLFSVTSRPDKEELNCLYGYAGLAYGVEVQAWVQREAERLIKLKAGESGLIWKGLFFYMKKGLGYRQMPDGCGDLKFNVYQF